MQTAHPLPAQRGSALLSWSALGTYVRLRTDRASAAGAAEGVARAVLDAVDRTCSRFRPDSDLVRANARAGAWVPVDPLLVAAVTVALDAAAQSDGLVDPTLGRALADLGYDRDFALVPYAGSDAAVPPQAARPGGWRDVEVDPDGALWVPPGCTLDLGATGKAWAADLVAAAIVDRTGSAVVVSLGGDLRALSPDDAPATVWPVGVSEVLTDGEPDELVAVHGGGVATSSTLGRRWLRAGREVHHLLDPRTGCPTSGPWRTVTATGHTCVAANTASTAALVLGEDAVPWLAERGVTARLVGRDGHVERLGRWPQPITRPFPQEAS